MMHLEFHGAIRTVTGSCFLLRANDKRILIDCGMFQGGRKIERRNEKGFLFDPKAIDFVLLTHGHIDHSGLLPKLVKEGFKGPIITTRATTDLLRVLLLDAGHIQEMEAKWRSRKALRAGDPPVDPLYTIDDAKVALERLRPVRYREAVDVCKGVKVVFRDAGHILGSAFIEMWVTEKGTTKKIIFSGDVGNNDQAVIKDPEVPDSADILLIESTYGDRNHKPRAETLKELANILIKAYNDGGNVVIPAFAVGRTQELLYQLHMLHAEGRLPGFNVFVDSPMAISATDIYREHSQCFDTQTMQLLLNGQGPFHLPNISYTRETASSKAINYTKGPNLIISASGMCDAGRILHHLKHNLWRRNAHIIFVGYQARGSLGRIIVEGEPRVKIMREKIVVAAKIHTIGGLSAHADQRLLLKWVEKLEKEKPLVYVVHGEEKSSAALAKRLKKDYGFEARIPLWHEVEHL